MTLIGIRSLNIALGILVLTLPILIKPANAQDRILVCFQAVEQHVIWNNGTKESHSYPQGGILKKILISGNRATFYSKSGGETFRLRIDRIGAGFSGNLGDRFYYFDGSNLFMADFSMANPNFPNGNTNIARFRCN